MLACVSTLRNVESYKNVRDKKRWLTTNEALSYIQDNCPFLNLLLSWSDKPYVVLYSWANWKTTMRPRLDVERVKDNGCRKVTFWCVKTIKEQEQLWKEYFESGNWRVKRNINLWAYQSYQEDQKAKNEKPVEVPHGSFYDPEWFI